MHFRTWAATCCRRAQWLSPIEGSYRLSSVPGRKPALLPPHMIGSQSDRFANSPWSVGGDLGIYTSDIGPEITRSPSAWTTDQWVTPTDHCEHKEQQ